MSEIRSNYFIARATDYSIQYASSSGGIGTIIIKYLLSHDDYGTSMTFIYNKEKCAYEPKLIYSFEEYNNCGSIYQDTDNIGFIKANIGNIKGGMIVTCMPCQVKAIRSILSKNKIKSFIISLCCSGQTTVKGTWYYYKLLGIKKEDVQNIQYRGNGWPSGVQITLADGRIIKRDNWTYPWTLMHSSLLFRPKRCLSCPFKTVPDADINLADPWLKEYENDTVGHSVVIVNTAEGVDVIKKLKLLHLICCKEIDEETYIQSQKGTIEEKKTHKDLRTYNRIIKALSSSRLYMSSVTLNSIMLKIHTNFILEIIRKICV